MSTTFTPPLPPPKAIAPSTLTSLSIVLPCLDEAGNIAEAITRAQHAASRLTLRQEVIVVDDGSTDATRAIVRSRASRDGRIRLVRHHVNRGYGAAVRSGIDASRNDWVFLTDADLQFDMSELELLVPLTADHDLIAGYRIDRADRPLRRLAAHAWNRLMRRTFAVSVRDVDCAFKLVRGDAARTLGLQSNGAMISTELLVRAEAAGLRIAEVGVHHLPRTAGRSTGGDPRVVLRAFRERRALKHELRDATPRSLGRRGLHRTPSLP